VIDLGKKTNIGYHGGKKCDGEEKRMGEIIPVARNTHNRHSDQRAGLKLPLPFVGVLNGSSGF
jgi:hypothetical protein